MAAFPTEVRSMVYTIEWTMFLGTNNPSKCDRVVVKLSQASGLPFNVVEGKRYWKDPSKTIVLCRNLIEASSLAEAIHLVMIASSRIASTWIVAAPGMAGSEYNATANLGSISIPGLESIAFRLSEGPGIESLLPFETGVNS